MSRVRTTWTIFVVGLVIAFGLVVGGSRLWGGAAGSPESNLTRQLAVINGVVITQEMVDREVKISRLNVVEPLPPLTGADLDRAREEALNQLLSRQLILQAASRQGFTLTPEYIEERAALLFGTDGDEALTEALAQAEAGYDDVLWWVGEIFTVEAFTTQVIMANAAPEERQAVFNEWLNSQRAEAKIRTFEDEGVQTTAALVGEPAPNFSLTTPQGQTISLSDYRGRVVLINFWATWCPSCVTEMPDYERVFQQHRPEFAVLGVNLQEGSSHVQQYAAGLGVTFPVLLDSDGVVTTRRYQVVGMPGSFIIDRQGKIFYRHVGPMSAETLTAKLAELGL